MEVVEDELRPLIASKDDGEEVEELIELICLCWNASPSTRPSFATITHTLNSYVKRVLLISN